MKHDRNSDIPDSQCSGRLATRLPLDLRLNLEESSSKSRGFQCPTHGRAARATHVFNRDTPIPSATANMTPASFLPERRLARLLTFSIAIAMTLLAGSCSAPAPAAQFVRQAQRLHDGALSATVVSDPDLSEYVQDIGERIAAAAHDAAPGKANADFLRQVKCHLVNCDTINVICTGGTHVYVYAGLMRECRSEDELAAAIAHAYAHLIDRDLEATKMRPDPRRPLVDVAWQFVTNRYTLAQEQSADRLALAIYVKAGWNPARFPILFERLEAATGGNVAPDRQPLPVRAADLREEASRLPRTRPVAPVADPKTYNTLRAQSATLREPAAPTVPLIILRAFPNCMLSGDTPIQRAAQERLRPPPPPPQKLEPS